MTLDDFRKMTPEELQKLAKSMVQPVRCGGTDYIDGKIHYRIQGWLVPGAVLDASGQEHNGNPWPGIKAYQDTHDRYPVPIRPRDKTKHH